VPDVSWPPEAGKLLPGAARAARVREKLAGYSLNEAHEAGGAKARGFRLILGITIADLDYLETSIKSGIAETPIASVRHNPPHGYNCLVEFDLQGRGERSGRAVRLRTVWRIAGPGEPPYLTTAYLRP
jgi:hypothetical protein